MRYRTFMQGAALLVLGATLYVGATAFNDYRRLGMLKGELTVWGLPADCGQDGMSCETIRSIERQTGHAYVPMAQVEAYIKKANKPQP